MKLINRLFINKYKNLVCIIDVTEFTSEINVYTPESIGCYDIFEIISMLKYEDDIKEFKQFLDDNNL